MRSIRFHYYMIFLFLIVSFVTMILMVTIIMLYRVPLIEKDNQKYILNASRDLSNRTEIILDDVLEKMRIFANASNYMEMENINSIIEDLIVQNEDISALILLDEDGIVVTASIRGASYQSGQNMIGNDMSYNPLYLDAHRLEKPVWSDKYLSVLAGNTTLGVAVPAGKYTAIAEVSMDYLLKTIRFVLGQAMMEVWVIDRRGEVVADTENLYIPGLDNLMGMDFVQEASQRDSHVQREIIKGKKYNIASSRSAVLGWIFLIRIPSGRNHPDIASRMLDMIFLILSQIILIFILTPFVFFFISRSIQDLTAYAKDIAENRVRTPWIPQRVKEINSLAENLDFMFDEIQNREHSLRDLNHELEGRVISRTKELKAANYELERSLKDLNLMKDELVEAEKLSALGGLVAGVAHELNTPLGNALMAVSTMTDTHLAFSEKAKGELSESDLEDYLDHMGMGLDISNRNLEKSAELVRSFKQVAVDQTSSKRRAFSLDEMLSELLMTLQPLIKRTPVKIIRNLQLGIFMNSYPGVLGQIVTNLITNAVEHGFPEGRDGEIFLICEQSPGHEVFIRVQDNGIGMPESVCKRIFEPFYTSKHGTGGTGLGLSIAFNGAKKVLGGTLEVKSKPDQGTTFTLVLPTTAPQLIDDIATATKIY